VEDCLSERGEVLGSVEAVPESGDGGLEGGVDNGDFEGREAVQDFGGVLAVLRRAVQRRRADNRAGCLLGGRIAGSTAAISEPVSGESRCVSYAAR